MSALRAMRAAEERGGRWRSQKKSSVRLRGFIVQRGHEVGREIFGEVLAGGMKANRFVVVNHHVKFSGQHCARHIHADVVFVFGPQQGYLSSVGGQ